jgi:intracellular sulfur oxidation DsrE/DsrF family protein
MRLAPRAAACALILSALAPPALRAEAPHRMVIHVNSPTRETMVEALNNAGNVIDYFRQRGSTATIEIVANGRGVTMFAAGMSPVGGELAAFHARYPDTVFDACASSLAAVGKALNRKLEVLPEARTVPSGAARILELEEQHWAYLKP